MTIGTVFLGSRNEKMEVRGRDLVAGLPHSVTLDSLEIEETLRESVYLIIHAIKGNLEQLLQSYLLILLIKVLFLLVVER